jgi:hypothetical protein
VARAAGRIQGCCDNIVNRARDHSRSRYSPSTPTSERDNKWHPPPGGSVLLQFRRKLPAARPRFIGAGRKVELLPTLSLAAA